MVDIRRLDRVNLLLELDDLCGSLLKVLLVLMFPSQRSFRSYIIQENPTLALIALIDRHVWPRLQN
jgi:hypothetical protein